MCLYIFIVNDIKTYKVGRDLSFTATVQTRKAQADEIIDKTLDHTWLRTNLLKIAYQKIFIEFNKYTVLSWCYTVPMHFGQFLNMRT